MQVIATAGHVDHGKSALVAALTGMQPDRWAEERRRGLTIGLGFVWTRVDEYEVAFVDVPGHDRFVRTMLAGAGPVPAVLFVVAADEGWMPQSEEHLSALDAFGVRHGLLAVTRSDLADPEPARQRALERIGSTSLGTVPSVAVSARSGSGLPQLRKLVAGLAGSLPHADTAADVRLWVDRAFGITGSGTVATGTLPAGSLRTGQELVLHSSGQRLGIRGLHALNHPRTEVSAVARVAVNLRGTHPDSIEHGDVLLTPGAWYGTGDVDVARHDGSDLPTHLTVHIGSAAVRARVRPLGPRAARLKLDRKLPLRVGDRLLLRDPGRHVVLDSVRVVDVCPALLRGRGAARSLGERIATLADQPTEWIAASYLRDRGPLRATRMRAMGLPACGVSLGEDWLVEGEHMRQLAGLLLAEVDSWQRQRPLAEGVPLETMRQQLGLPDTTAVTTLARDAGLVCSGGVVRRQQDGRYLPETVQRAVDTVRAQLRDAPFAAPDANRLRELGLGPKELAAAARTGQLYKVADGVVLLPDAPQEARRLLGELAQPFTLSQARRALDTTRRVAVPLLESLDDAGFTVRLPDDTRRVRQ